MRGFLVFLIFMPLVVLGGTFTWVASSQPSPEDTSIELPSIGKPPETDDAAVKKGWEVFTTKGCVYCHGPNAAGGVANNNAVGKTVPGLTKVWEGYSEEELRERILMGIKDISKEDPNGPHPPLNMPSWEGSLSDKELDSLVAYLMSFKPEGAEEDEW